MTLLWLKAHNCFKKNFFFFEFPVVITTISKTAKATDSESGERVLKWTSVECHNGAPSHGAEVSSLPPCGSSLAYGQELVLCADIESGFEDTGRGKGKLGRSERVAWTYIHYQM